MSEKEENDLFYACSPIEHVDAKRRTGAATWAT
jgi:hypothetical protein